CGSHVTQPEASFPLEGEPRKSCRGRSMSDTSVLRTDTTPMRSSSGPNSENEELENETQNLPFVGAARVLSCSRLQIGFTGVLPQGSSNSQRPLHHGRRSLRRCASLLRQQDRSHAQSRPAGFAGNA